MMATYAYIDGTKVLGFFEDVAEGPIEEDRPYQATAELVLNYPEAPSPTAELHIDAAGQLVWQEMASVVELAAAAIARTYKDVDAIYTDAIGAREPEYKDAEIEARRYVAAGYTGSVNTDISAFAQYNPTGQQQTNQWAADVIIARANAFATAKSMMRSTRFACQAQMQAAGSVELLAEAIATWNGFISTLRSQLGLPPGGN